MSLICGQRSSRHDIAAAAKRIMAAANFSAKPVAVNPVSQAPGYFFVDKLTNQYTNILR